MPGAESGTYVPGSAIPCRPAQAAIPAREGTASLRRMLVTWASTVRSLMKSASAISRLARPAAMWAATSRSRGVSPPSGVSAGPRVGAPPSGYRYVLELVPGAHSVDQIIGAVNALRGGLRLMPGQDVIVEEHPTEPAPTALLTIVTRPVINRPQRWPGPQAGFERRHARAAPGAPAGRQCRYSACRRS